MLPHSIAGQCSSAVALSRTLLLMAWLLWRSLTAWLANAPLLWRSLALGCSVLVCCGAPSQHGWPMLLCIGRLSHTRLLSACLLCGAPSQHGWPMLLCCGALSHLAAQNCLCVLWVLLQMLVLKLVTLSATCSAHETASLADKQ